MKLHTWRVTSNSGLYIQVALLPSILKPFSETMNEFSVKQLCGIVSVNKLLKKRMLLMSSIKQPLSVKELHVYVHSIQEVAIVWHSW